MGAESIPAYNHGSVHCCLRYLKKKNRTFTLKAWCSNAPEVQPIQSRISIIVCVILSVFAPFQGDCSTLTWYLKKKIILTALLDCRTHNNTCSYGGNIIVN